MSDDPFREAFETRRNNVTTGVDSTAGLAEVEHRGAATQRRRTLSTAAIVVVVVGGLGLAWAGRLNGPAEGSEIATAAGVTATSTGPPATSAGLSPGALDTSAAFATTTTETPPPSTTTSTSTTSTVLDAGPPLYPVPILATGSSLAEYPCVLDNKTLVAASNAATNGPYAAPLGPTPGTGIAAITQEVAGDCERTVITLDGPGFAEGTTAAGTTTGMRVDLPGVTLLPGVELAESVTYLAGDASTSQPRIELSTAAGSTIVSYGDNPARIIVDHRPDVG